MTWRKADLRDPFGRYHALPTHLCTLLLKVALLLVAHLLALLCTDKAAKIPVLNPPVGSS
jgi:hypothetical protein